jgi:HAD superfamily hydrolase (TIGR01549 family)
VDKVLDKLHTEWTLALAINAVDSNERDIRAALRRVGLNQMIDEVDCFRRIGYRKPEPTFYKYILNDLGLDQNQVIMVGDDSKIM